MSHVSVWVCVHVHCSVFLTIWHIYLVDICVWKLKTPLVERHQSVKSPCMVTTQGPAILNTTTQGTAIPNTTTQGPAILSTTTQGLAILSTTTQ